MKRDKLLEIILYVNLFFSIVYWVMLTYGIHRLQLLNQFIESYPIHKNTSMGLEIIFYKSLKIDSDLYISSKYIKLSFIFGFLASLIVVLFNKRLLNLKLFLIYLFTALTNCIYCIIILKINHEFISKLGFMNDLTYGFKFSVVIIIVYCFFRNVFLLLTKKEPDFDSDIDFGLFYDPVNWIFAILVFGCSLFLTFVLPG